MLGNLPKETRYLSTVAREQLSVTANSSDYGRLFFQAEVFHAQRLSERRARPAGAIVEPARRVQLFRDCDVLVVGGGPAGTTAAIAAARVGADVVLIERYNHLGGLSTGGLVIWIDRMTDWSGRRVIEGIAAELLDRLPRDAVAGPSRSDWGSTDAATAAYWKERTAAFHGIVTWSATIVEEGRVAGAVVESKEGRLAIRAKVTIDCTGDGDLFYRAGAGSERDIDERDIHHCTNTAWLFGGVDMPGWIAFKTGDPQGFKAFLERGRKACGGLFERPFVSWRDDVALFLGPRLAGYSAVDVEDQTEVEIRSHRLMAQHLTVYREHGPGFANAYLLLSAPQLGVRHARRLVGIGRVTREDWSNATPRPDEIGISPSLSPRFPLLSVPYGCLVPRDIDGLLVAGRHISCDPSSHSFLREIPQCWLTGQAAGVPAALAGAERCAPRALPIAALQAALRRQQVLLRAEVEPALA